ncbi:ABC transporter permease [Allosalinactinospora lopnorensis]|uniref:ABC transporter permease n=1 Tax=Allosalinactinospora lopnorensis TaxID=1352348 RepID=UPI000623CF5E|nr:ABC transporter permease [Allosalinactinospora lopnorensis]
MSTLVKLTAVEGRLFLREPMAVIFGVVFPTILLLGMGAIPVLREPSPDFGGARFVEFWAPSALVLGLGILGVQHIPATIATYRENGILRRMSTTPVHPGKVLAAQLIVALAAAAAAAGLLVVAAWLVLDVPLPEHPWWFTLAFVVGYGALLAIGILIAAVTPNVRTANGFAMLAYMAFMFLGGVFLPRFTLPDVVVRIGDYTPPGVQALLDAWFGDTGAATAVGVETAGPPQLAQLAIMALIAVAAGAVAAKLFRWE